MTCSCGTTSAHEIARRTTSDGVVLLFWSDGLVTGRVGHYLPGIGAKRLAGGGSAPGPPPLCPCTRDTPLGRVSPPWPRYALTAPFCLALACATAVPALALHAPMPAGARAAVPASSLHATHAVSRYEASAWEFNTWWRLAVAVCLCEIEVLLPESEP